MSVNRVKVFKVKLTGGNRFSVDTATQNVIGEFLDNPNNVYVGHSTSVLAEDVEEYGLIKSINKFLLITLVYKDLSDSPHDLKGVSRKTSRVVVRHFESGKEVPEPPFETAFDKECKSIAKPVLPPPDDLLARLVGQAEKQKRS